MGLGRASFVRAGVLIMAALFVSGCASPSEGLLVALPDPALAERTLTVLAVTTRSPAGPQQTGQMFSGERASGVHYVSLKLSMPPDRALGALPTDARKQDPTKNIVLVSSRELSLAEFNEIVTGTSVAPAAQPVRNARQKPAARAPAIPQREALVFVHGFNTRFDESVVRLAQIVDDTRFNGVPILFSWPSRGEVSAYGYDKDSANYSRDTLESLLAMLARDRGISGIDVIGHSMGGWLTMETLRSLAVANDQATLNRINKVVLAAPDVDMDVFRTQVARLGPLAKRMTVYVSSDDYALRFSGRLFGEKVRAGDNTDKAQFAAMGVTVQDISQLPGGIGKNHGKAFGDGATITAIGETLNHSGPPGSGIANGVKEIGNSLTGVTEASMTGAQ